MGFPLSPSSSSTVVSHMTFITLTKPLRTYLLILVKSSKHTFINSASAGTSYFRRRPWRDAKKVLSSRKDWGIDDLDKKGSTERITVSKNNVASVYLDQYSSESVRVDRHEE